MPRRAWRGCSALLALQPQRRAVHAVALAGGAGTVGEDVAQVSPAVAAHGLGADHPVAHVGLLFHGPRIERLEEARPAGPRFELGVRREQGLAATDALVGAVVVAVPVLAGEGTL